MGCSIVPWCSSGITYSLNICQASRVLRSWHTLPGTSFSTKSKHLRPPRRPQQALSDRLPVLSSVCPSVCLPSYNLSVHPSDFPSTLPTILASDRQSIREAGGRLPGEVRDGAPLEQTTHHKSCKSKWNHVKPNKIGRKL